MNEQDKDLRRFSEMDNVEVAEDDPDVRGWEVTTTDGRDLGEVKDLLVDTRTMKVRGLEVELEGSTFNWTDNRRVVVPVDSVRVNTDDDRVVISGMRFEDIGNLRPFGSSWTGGTATPGTAYGTERPLRDEVRGYAGPGAEGLARSSEQLRGAEGERLTRSEEELEIEKHERNAGEVRVGKHVETERVSQPVTRERERVRIETRPISGETIGSEARFQDDEIRVPVTEEELSVTKRPVAKEELVISKERVIEDETVQADLRKERFDIKDEGHALDEKGNLRPKRGDR
jgi:uncharacterized protein (TIGR02271 family)